MPRVRVEIHADGIRDLLHDAGVVGELESRMQRVLAAAKASAPVATGAYRDSLHLETVNHPSRTVVRVVSDSDHAMTVEASHGTLSRALDSAGGA